MTLDYYLFVYSEAPDSGIPLGVLLHDGQNALVKAVGLSKDWRFINPAPFRALSGRTKSLGWVYESWMVTLKEIIGETRGDAVYFGQLVHEFGGAPVGFSLLKDGYIEIAEDGTPEGALDHLFGELVTPFFPGLY
jgi:hypothetical protein